MEGLLPADGELVPRLWSRQDLADRTLGQSQHVVAKHALADVVLDQLLFHLAGDLRRVHVLAVQHAAGVGVGVAGRRRRGAARCAAPVDGSHVRTGRRRLGAAGCQRDGSRPRAGRGGRDGGEGWSEGGEQERSTVDSR